MQDNGSRDLALVTGASSGIGAELARELVRHGHDVVLTARRAPELETLATELRAAGAVATVVTKDLSIPGAALTALTRALLPGMIARGRGRVMLVSSTAAFQPGPNMAAYCASKAYVLSLGEALARELRGTGVTLTTLCPGATHSGFARAAGAESLPLFTSKLVPKMSSASVARAGYDAMMRGKPVLVTGIMNKLVAVSGRVFPRAIVFPVARFLLGDHS
jgi:uncharacterized protein